MTPELRGVVEVFQRWLFLPEPAPLLVVLGSVAANRMPGEPVWPLLVGPPGCGKSEILQAASGQPDVRAVSTITEAGLLTGASKRDWRTGAKGGLLKEIGKFGILVLKDFGSVLSMHPEKRAPLLAAFREIYDGRLDRVLGNDGGRRLHWAGKLGLLGGCTEAIERHHAVMASMGERFVLFRMPQLDEMEQARRAIAEADHGDEMRAALRSAVDGLFASTCAPSPSDAVLAAISPRLIALSTLVARCRSGVERDGYTRDIEVVPGSEAPGRLAKVLRLLFGGLYAIGLTEEEAWGLVEKVGFDSMPVARRRIVDWFRESPGRAVGVMALEEVTGISRSATYRHLKDLAAHDVVRNDPYGEADAWRLSDFAQERLQELQVSGGSIASVPGELTGDAGAPLSCSRSVGPSPTGGTVPDLSGTPTHRVAVPETSALPSSVPDPSGDGCAVPDSSASLPPNTVPERSAFPLLLIKREEDISEKSEGDVSGTTGGGDISGTLPPEGRYWPPFDDDDDAEPAVLVGKPN